MMSFHKNTVHLLMLLTLSALSAPAALAVTTTTANNAPPNNIAMPVIQPATIDVCYNAIGNHVGICGQNIMLPSLIGTAPSTALSVPMPAPFIASSVTVGCAYDIHMRPFFQVFGATDQTCRLRQCGDGIASFCDMQLPIPGGATVGQTVSIPVSDTLFSDPQTQHNFAVSAQCMIDGDGASYKMQDAFSISCNPFPCAAANLPLCGVDVPVGGGAALGAIFQMKMPPPFAPDSFTVQCLGSNGNRPTYQVTDTTAVTCKPATP